MVVLKIHEFILPNGELSSVSLRRDGAVLTLLGEEGELTLPTGALRAVMLRYGAPFDADAVSDTQATLELDGDTRLRHVRHLAGYDVIARDYLVYSEPGLEAVCALATSVAGALRHLGLAAHRAASEALGKEG